MSSSKSRRRRSRKSSPARRALQQRTSQAYETLEQRQLLANVALFANASFVDPGGEVASMAASLNSMGHSVTQFSNVDPGGIQSVLQGKDVLVIPELERGDLHIALSPSAMNEIRQFVGQGGGLIVNGSNNFYDVNLIQSVFGYSLSDGGVLGSGNARPLNVVAAQGTEFANGPSSLTAVNLTSRAFNFQNYGGRDIYADGMVGTLPYQQGNLIYLGWDWDGANGTWNEVLRRAVLEAHNVAPQIANVSGPSQVSEGTSVTFNGSFTDLQQQDGHTQKWTVSASNGQVIAPLTISNSPSGSGSSSFQFAPNDNGTYQVTYQVIDVHGASSSQTVQLTVANVEPDLTISGPSTVYEGNAYLLNLGASDPGNDTISEWFVDWGDGSDPDNDQSVGEILAGNATSASHVYADGTRSHTIRATATDEDGTYAAEALGVGTVASLDSTFGNGGVVTHDFFGSTSDFVRDTVVVLPDGKILVVGNVQGGIQRIGLARYLPDGTPDNSFGTNGQVVAEFDLSQSAEGVAVDSLERILVIGSDGIARFNPDGSLDTTFGNNGLVNTITGLNTIKLDAFGNIVVSSSNQIARLLQNGAFDTSFDIDGRLTTSPMIAQDFVFDDTGNLVVVGYQYNGSNYDLAVRRYSSLGQLDTSFGDGGAKVFNFGGQQGDFGYAIGRYGNGFMIAGRALGTYNGTNYDFYDQILIQLDGSGQPVAGFGNSGNGVTHYGLGTQLYGGLPSAITSDALGRIYMGSSSGVARFSSTGILDTTFDSDGISTFPGLNSVSSLTFDGAGKLIVGGARYSASTGYDFAVSKLNVNDGQGATPDNGSLDATFAVGGPDGNGVVTTNFQGSTQEFARDLVEVLSDGKLLALGAKVSGSSYDIVLARYLPNGVLDTSFAANDGDGIDGMAITDFFGGSESPNAMAVDSNGMIYACFSAYVIRYTADGTLDTSFGDAYGRAYTGLSQVYDIGVNSANEVLVAGYRFQQHPGTTVSSADMAVTRLLANGSVDTSFGNAGYAIADLGTTSNVRSDEIPQAMSIDPLDRIVISGYTQEYSVSPGQTVFLDQDAFTARFDVDGILDASFSGGGAVVTDFGTNENSRALAIDSQGRILTNVNNQLRRFNDDGSLDTSFGSSGSYSLWTTPTSITVDSEDRIISVGSDYIFRNLDNGAPDADFAPNGRLDTNLGSYSAVIVDQAGRIVVGGQSFTTSSSGADFLVARFATDGLPITVQNLPPQIVSVAVPSTATEGANLSLSASATDPAGSADPLSYSWTISFNGSTYQVASGANITLTPIDNGTYVATLVVNDGDGGSVGTSRTIVVSNVAPVGTFHAPATGTEGSPFSVSITNPFDPSLADTNVGFSYSFDFGNGYGPYVTTNSASFTPADNGTFNVKARIRDKNGGVTEYTSIVEVGNVAPTANSDNASVSEDASSLLISPLSNDTDPAGANDPLKVTGVDTSGTLGSVSFNGTSITYSPNGQFEHLRQGQTATDTFTYFISDGDGGVSSATVTVQINGQNDVAQLGGDIAGSTNEDSLSLISGDLAIVDPDQNEAAVVSQSGTAGNYGTFSINSVGAWTYILSNEAVQQLKAGQQVSDQFTVVSYDGTANTVVTIDVAGLNDSASIYGDLNGDSDEESTTAITGQVFAIDLDQGEDQVQLSGNTVGSYGTITMDADGKWSYAFDHNALQELPAGYHVEDYFHVSSLDGTAISQIVIRIEGRNDAPSVSGPIAAAATERDAIFFVNLLQGASDIDLGTTLNVQSLNLVSGDDRGITLDGNSLSVDPSAYGYLATGETESIEYSYTISDGDGGSVSQTATIEITAVNTDPNIDSDVFAIDENLQVVGGVIASDPDAGDTILYSITGNGADDDLFEIDASLGTLRFKNSADFETPLDANGDNVYEVDVEVSDGQGGYATRTIQVNVLNRASLTGNVFVDVNGDGLMQANEPGIDGVVVELLDAYGNAVLDENSQPITAITSSGGFFLLEDVAPGVYQIREIQPTGVGDGAEILGSAGGLVVANDTMQLTLDRDDVSDYAFAELGQTLASGDTASIGFWQNKHGQALITAGGTVLANWLSQNFGNVFGNTFTDGLGGDGGAEVASFYKDQLFKQKATKSAGPAKVDAQFMATALATFFTSSNLAGTTAASFGFNVSQTGIGTNVINVGNSGAAFGVANGTSMTIMQLLMATNELTDLPNNLNGAANVYDLNGDGVIDAYEASLRTMANAIYSLINESGNF